MRKEQDKKTLIFGTPEGLGNRLFIMAHGLRLARLTKRKPIFWWPKTNSCEINFEELFEPLKGLEVVRWKKKEIPIKKIDCYIHTGNLKKRGLEKRYYIPLNKNLKNVFIKLPTSCFLYEERELLKNAEFRKKVEKEISLNIRRLKPIKELREKIGGFSTRFDRDTISIHLRRTDYAIWLAGDIPTDKEVLKMLKEYAEKKTGIKFFLATDSKETECKLKKELREKIIIYPKKHWVEKRYKDKRWGKNNIYRPKDSVKESLIELYLLSKNETFIKFERHSGHFDRLPSILNPNQKVIVLKRERNITEILSNKFKKLNYMTKESLNTPDLLIGKIGLLLKNNHPRMYYQLRKLKIRK